MQQTTLLLITDHFLQFAKNSVPYIMNVLLYGYLSLALEKLILSIYLITKIISKHYLISKVILSATVIIFKYSLSCAESNCFLIVTVHQSHNYSSDIESHELQKIRTNCDKYHSNIILFWMTVLILVSCSKTKANHCDQS